MLRKMIKKKVMKKKPAKAAPFVKSSSAMVNTEERAYRIWESKGKPANTALEDWVQAEQSSH